MLFKTSRETLVPFSSTPISLMCGIVQFQRESVDMADLSVRTPSLFLLYNDDIVIGDLVIEPEASKIVEEMVNQDDILVE
jgi:hypothetical protein